MTPIFGPRRSSSVLVPTVVPCTIECMRGRAAERVEAVQKAHAPRRRAATAPWRCGSGRFAASSKNRSVNVPPTSTPTMTPRPLMPRPAQPSRWRRRRASRRRCSDDLVVAARGFARDVAEPHVASDALRVARRRIAEAAAARRFQPHLLAAADLDVRDLRDQRRRRLALIGLIDKAVERRRPAAVDAERRILAALAEQEHVGAAVRQRFDLVDRAEPAAMPARRRRNPAAAPIA